MLFGKKKGVFGLDIGSSSVKVVELTGKLNSLSLVNLGYDNLPNETIVDGQIMELNTVSEVIQSVCKTHAIKNNDVVTGVSGHSVIIKNIILPAMSREELEESIDWHAEEHIPYDLSEVSLDYHVAYEDSEAIQVMIAACKQERLDNIKQAVQLAGKNPVIIDVDTFALQNCYEVNYKPTEADVVTLLNIGASTMNVNIVQGGNSLFTRDITVGGSQFTDILQRSLGYSFEEAEAIKRGVTDDEEARETAIEPLIDNVTETIALEIQKTFDFYRATTEDENIGVQKILLSGGGAKLTGLAEDLADKLDIEVEMLDPFREVNVDPRKFDPDYLTEISPEMAVAVGLAIRGAEVK